MAHLQADLVGISGLWAMLSAGMTIEELGPKFEVRVANNQADAGTLMDLSTLLILTRINRGAKSGYDTRRDSNEGY